MTAKPQFSLSIVSHGQGTLVAHLLDDLRGAHGASFEVLLTLNIAEDEGFIEQFSDMPIVLVRNEQAKGFGANHNQAFRKSLGSVFVVINPDIRATTLNLDSIWRCLADTNIGAYAPRVLSALGLTEDSARRFPTFANLAMRTLLRRRRSQYDLSGAELVPVDWVAGMFVAYPRSAFRTVGGFDERYFMYMEDADICRRLRQRGLEVVFDGRCSVVHDAQRASHRDLRHLRWHLRSAIRFLTDI